jgi:sugar lactone lactonase YvrE
MGRATGRVRFRSVGMVRALLALVATLAWCLSLSGVGAQGATGTVVASGLSSPRFIAVTDDGTLYVSEAGSGGTEKVSGGPDGEDTMRGKTGQVTKIAPNGAKSVVAGNLPSYGSGEGATGPAGIVLANGAIWLANGNFVPQGTALSYEGQVVKIDPQSGAVAKVADIGANEIAHNPDGTAVDSDLYGMALGKDGNLYVADAAGNDLYQVTPSGQLKVVAIFPGLPAQEANPDRGGKMEVDPVPTGIAVAPDGSFYVAFLGGGEPTPGRSKVVKVTADGKISDAATGLTYTVGVAVGPDGLLYVSELTTGLDTSANPPMPKPGRVSRILPNGTKQVVADNLNAPNGLAFDKAGNLFVATGSVDPQNGQVMRFAGVAAAATTAPPAATAPPVTTAPPVATTPPTVTAPSTTGAGIAGPLNYVVRRLGDS